MARPRAIHPKPEDLGSKPTSQRQPDQDSIKGVYNGFPALAWNHLADLTSLYCLTLYYSNSSRQSLPRHTGSQQVSILFNFIISVWVLSSFISLPCLDLTGNGPAYLLPPARIPGSIISIITRCV